MYIYVCIIYLFIIFQVFILTNVSTYVDMRSSFHFSQRWPKYM